MSPLMRRQMYILSIPALSPISRTGNHARCSTGQKSSILRHLWWQRDVMSRWPQRSLKKDASVDLIIGNNRKAELADILDARLAEKNEENRVYVLDIAHTHEYERLHLDRLGGHTRAFIKVQDGCNQFCSYCIIPTPEEESAAAAMRMWQRR